MDSNIQSYFACQSRCDSRFDRIGSPTKRFGMYDALASAMLPLVATWQTDCPLPCSETWRPPCADYVRNLQCGATLCVLRKAAIRPEVCFAEAAIFVSADIRLPGAGGVRKLNKPMPVLGSSDKCRLLIQV